MKKKEIFRDRSGFTMVEVLVALAVFSILSGAVFALFTKNVRTHSAQSQVTDMQQDLRAGLMIMAKEIRMAGYEVASKTADSGIATATADTLRFTADLDGDGTPNDTDEDVTYLLYTADGANKVGRGIPGASGMVTNPLVENVEANGMRFAYAVDDGNGRYLVNDGGFVVWAVPGAGGNWLDLDVNEDGIIDAADDAADGAEDGVIDGRDTGVAVEVDRRDIRAVRIWMLVRTPTADPDLSFGAQLFVVGNRVLDYNDNVRRRLLTSVVKCRNMGL